MAIVVKKYSVNTGDRLYYPGETIHDLGIQDEKRLVDGGYCDFVDKQDASHLSIEEFSALKAGEQRAELKSHGIDPASNDEQRVQQFTEWLSKQESGEHEPI